MAREYSHLPNLYSDNHTICISSISKYTKHFRTRSLDPCSFAIDPAATPEMFDLLKDLCDEYSSKVKIKILTIQFNGSLIKA